MVALQRIPVWLVLKMFKVQHYFHMHILHLSGAGKEVKSGTRDQVAGNFTAQAGDGREIKYCMNAPLPLHISISWKVQAKEE